MTFWWAYIRRGFIFGGSYFLGGNLALFSGGLYSEGFFWGELILGGGYFWRLIDSLRYYHQRQTTIMCRACLNREEQHGLAAIFVLKLPANVVVVVENVWPFF